VLDDADGPSSLAASMSAVAEQLKSWIDGVAANGVHLGSHSALVAAMSHFLELDVDLEVLRSGHNVGLIEDEVDAFWSRVCTAADSLALHVHFSGARNPPNGAGE
jgi:hypothetical protein